MINFIWELHLQSQRHPSHLRYLLSPANEVMGEELAFPHFSGRTMGYSHSLSGCNCTDSSLLCFVIWSHTCPLALSRG